MSKSKYFAERCFTHGILTWLQKEWHWTCRKMMKSEDWEWSFDSTPKFGKVNKQFSEENKRNCKYYDQSRNPCTISKRPERQQAWPLGMPKRWLFHRSWCSVTGTHFTPIIICTSLHIVLGLFWVSRHLLNIQSGDQGDTRFCHLATSWKGLKLRKKNVPQPASWSPWITTAVATTAVVHTVYIETRFPKSWFMPLNGIKSDARRWCNFLMICYTHESWDARENNLVGCVGKGNDGWYTSNWRSC